MPAAQPSPPCPNPRKGALIGTSGNLQVVIPAKCNAWRCPSCAPAKAYKLQLRLERCTPNRFITLTHNPVTDETPETALRRMRADWHQLHKAINRNNGGANCRYALVVEWTKAGWPHFHILMASRYLSQRDLSRAWKRIHGAPIVDIRRVREGKKAARYLAKYLTKHTPLPPRMRRWSASRGFVPPSEPWTDPNLPTDITWRYIPSSPLAFLSAPSQMHLIAVEGHRNSVLLIDPDPGRT